MKKKSIFNPAPDQEINEDERVQRSKKAVLTATFQLLSETGLTGVSIDQVSRRSGVAKTTIYRHWPSRSALVLDACSRLKPKSEAPDTGNLKDDVTVLALNLASRLRTARWATVLPSMIDAAERDPELADLHSRMHAEMTTAFRAVIKRSQQRGELSRHRRPTEVVAMILGPLFYRRWFSREPLDEGFVKRVVESAVSGLKERS
ncbi:MAG TPA: TetR/AcrR family transcriptional regulator [Chthoniobacterales bacterium]|nr:TetR/AcrR family transcriptional regulator [Chthoniobacterales bacterium]